MKKEVVEAIEYLEDDAEFLDRFARRYDTPGMSWLAARIRNNAQRSRDLASLLRTDPQPKDAEAGVTRLASITPYDGQPRSRMVNKDFVPVTESITGHPAGLPNLSGVVKLTNGVEHVIAAPDGRRFIVHSGWFERTDKLPPGRYHCLEIEKKSSKAKSPRRKNGDKLPSAVNLDEYQ